MTDEAQACSNVDLLDSLDGSFTLLELKERSRGFLRFFESLLAGRRRAWAPFEKLIQVLNVVAQVDIICELKLLLGNPAQLEKLFALPVRDLARGALIFRLLLAGCLELLKERFEG